MILIAERITCRCIFQTNGSSDIAGINGVDILSVVSVHLKDTSDTLGVILCRVIYVRTCVQCTCIYTEEAELTDIGVSSDLERKSCKGLGIGRRNFHFLFGFGIDALDRRNVCRSGHIVNNRIEQLLNALVAVRSTAGDRHHSVVDG